MDLWEQELIDEVNYYEEDNEEFEENLHSDKNVNTQPKIKVNTNSWQFRLLSFSIVNGRPGLMRQ